MRIRTVAIIIAVLLPAALGAQRLPRPGTKRSPAEPVPLPPAPGPIEYVLAMKRSHLTVESYPLVSRVQAPGFAANGLISAWTTVGAGTRFDYRFSRFVSGTFDLTSSLLGGPANFTTAELGTRLHRERTESRFYPFIDLRAGVMAATNRDPRYAVADFSGSGATPTDRYSVGFGGVAGIGTEYALTGSWSLTTEGSLLRNHMSMQGLAASQSTQRSYGMTWWRYSFGVSYNALRMVRIPGGDAR